MPNDSMSGNESSPTKYLPREPGSETRSVSFALPSGTFATMQDHVGSKIGKPHVHLNVRQSV